VARLVLRAARPVEGRGVLLVESALRFELVKRRLKDAGLPKRLSPHSLRATTATDLLSQGVPLDEVQYLLGHAEPRTTGLYNRRKKKVTRNIVERISI
jgi:site-specific recombinase XerD